MKFTEGLWDTTDFSFGPQIKTSEILSRNTVHDRLVDSVYSGIGYVKEAVRKTVYNDKELDLPELSILGLGNSSSSKAKHGNAGPSDSQNSTSRNGFARTKAEDSNAGMRKTVYLDHEDPFTNEFDEAEIARGPKRTYGVDGRFEIKSDGREREFKLHIPPQYDGTKPMPLVVMLHGLSQDADEIAELSRMSEKADKEGFIVAYPNATKWLGISAIRAWDVDNGVQLPLTDSNDVQFIRDMVDTIKENLNVDDNRVYAAGFSNGGMMAYRLAGEMSDTFSAVAVVSGAASGNEVKPEQSVSVMAIHGTRDHVVPYFGLKLGSALSSLGVPRFESFKNSFSQWRENAGIKAQPNVEKADGIITRRSYDPDTGTEVIAYSIKGGTHEWPGSQRARDRNPKSNEANFKATDRIWEFFSAHPKNKIKFVPMENAISV